MDCRLLNRKKNNKNVIHFSVIHYFTFQTLFSSYYLSARRTRNYKKKKKNHAMCVMSLFRSENDVRIYRHRARDELRAEI